MAQLLAGAREAVRGITGWAAGAGGRQRGRLSASTVNARSAGVQASCTHSYSLAQRGESGAPRLQQAEHRMPWDDDKKDGYRGDQVLIREQGARSPWVARLNRQTANGDARVWVWVWVWVTCTERPVAAPGRRRARQAP